MNLRSSSLRPFKRHNVRSKKRVVVGWLLFLLAGIVALFWRYEWVYNLPTPVPVSYQDVRPGVRIDLPKDQLALIRMTGSDQGQGIGKKPVFLHFFNPDCPCSRFNMPHFKALMKLYDRQVDFAIVLMTDKKYSAGQIRDRFDLPYPIPVLTGSALAVACGVYSTPQAVIIDTAQKLFYRGNYNRSRYCSDEKSSYAKMALEGLLQNDLAQHFSPLALKAYGCQLPTCTR
ncbi:MAG TPA: hypothetical protein VF939_17010 [Puia sp.]